MTIYIRQLINLCLFSSPLFFSHSYIIEFDYKWNHVKKNDEGETQNKSGWCIKRNASDFFSGKKFV